MAQLAGVPRSVILRAKTKLQELENQAYQHGFGREEPAQVDLFSAAAECHPVVTHLQEINPDQLTPKEALELLYQLKGEV